MLGFMKSGFQSLMGIGGHRVSAPKVDTAAGTKAIQNQAQQAQNAANAGAYGLAASHQANPLAIREAQKRAMMAQGQISQNAMNQQRMLEQSASQQNAQLSMQAQGANMQAKQGEDAAWMNTLGTVAAGAMLMSDEQSKQYVLSPGEAKQDIRPIAAGGITPYGGYAQASQLTEAPTTVETYRPPAAQARMLPLDTQAGAGFGRDYGLTRGDVQQMLDRGPQNPAPTQQVQQPTQNHMAMWQAQRQAYDEDMRRRQAAGMFMQLSDEHSKQKIGELDKENQYMRLLLGKNAPAPAAPPLEGHPGTAYTSRDKALSDQQKWFRENSIARHFAEEDSKKAAAKAQNDWFVENSLARHYAQEDAKRAAPPPAPPAPAPMLQSAMYAPPSIRSDKQSKMGFDKLEPVSYEYKPQFQPEGGQGRQYGLIAQDMERASPALASTVFQGPDGLRRVDTGKLTMVNSAELADLNKRLAMLEGKKRG